MKKRLIRGILLTVTVALLVSGAINIWVFYRQELGDARQSLRETLTLMDAQDSATKPEELAEQFAQASPDKRLTIIAADGTVLADTASDAAAMKNHLDRAEIRQAIATGWGEDTRPSETINVRMLYVAKRFSDGMIGRAATPLSSIGALVQRSLGGFVIAALVALVLTFLLVGQLARMVLKPLTIVSDILQGAPGGSQDRAAFSQYDHDDEVRPMLRSIDKLMEQLETYIDGLKAERDKVNLILDCMDEGLILLDQGGKVLAINGAARRLFGVAEGTDAGSISLLTRSRRLREALGRVREAQSPVVLDMEDPAFGSRSLRFFLSPVTGRRFEGEAVGCSILISDVTDLKRAEGIRSEFTANVSHELKTPLTSIKGFTDMLASGMVQGAEDQKRFLTMIGVEVDRLIDLINDILKLSELESVAIPQSGEESDALEAARAAEALLLPAAGEAGVRLIVEGEGSKVAVPASRLKELFLNLIENGIKYNEPGGRVDVRVASESGRVVITVADTGIGIPPEAKDRVFERFYRVDRGRARKNGGTGLGLAIVKHIVQLYGGSLALESVLGKGSTFTITLPERQS